MSDHSKILNSLKTSITNIKNKLKKMFTIKSHRNSFKEVVDVMSLNKYLNSHVIIDVDNDEEYIKTTKLIKIVNNILDEYDMSILYNRHAFEKAKAFMIKDMIKSSTLKLTKDVIKNYLDSRLTGVRAYSLRKKYNEKQP